MPDQVRHDMVAILTCQVNKAEMKFDLTTWRWHRAIIADAKKKLGRKLKPHEKEFITSRGGFIALEMIHDTVKSVGKEELESYLGSEKH
jgi:hypothetical protein